MPPGMPSSTQPGAVPGTSAAMAVHGLLDQQPPEEPISDGRKAKRELSQSKRAAQNRAAQRAFRLRKESYIKHLEAQVHQYSGMEQNLKSLQNENLALREYVVQLQSRLLDLQVELPPPPPSIKLSPPAAGNSRPAAPPNANLAEEAPGAGTTGSLAEVAAAVAGLRAQEPSTEALYAKPQVKPESERRGTEEARRLQHGGLPPPSALRT